MFLHGGVGHLLGNMIFLWLVGCMLEMGCGRFLLFVLYVVGGLFAVGLFWLTNMNSIVPLVGASGSIAGLMGAFTVLYGKKRVKIFLSLGFFFHYLKIPAIILLPVWIGKEFYQLAFSDMRQIAYWAHIGGLAGGALLGFLCLKFIPFINTDALEEEPEDEISPLLEKALKHISELDHDTGRRLLKQVLALDPKHTAAMVHLFNIDKLDPEDQNFHESTKKLLAHLSRSPDTYQKAHEIYCEYLKHTKQPRLSPQIYLQLSLVFAAGGHLENAVKILMFLLKKVPQFPGIPTALLKLANAYQQKGMGEKWKRCLQLICSKYPNSTEAQVAKRSLQGG
jgi:tetratricopeptide (TPR) repeat protein